MGVKMLTVLMSCFYPPPYPPCMGEGMMFLSYTLLFFAQLRPRERSNLTESPGTAGGLFG